MYLKQAPSLLNAFSNCFMKPRLIFSGGSTTLDLSTRAERLAHRPVMFSTTINPVPAVPFAHKTRVFCKSRL